MDVLIGNNYHDTWSNFERQNSNVLEFRENVGQDQSSK